jgi:hypothetical protein
MMSQQPMDKPDESSDSQPEHETAADVRAERLLLERAIGGWRGIIDSGLPTVTFVAVYIAMGSDADALRTALWCAVGAGVAVVVWRLIRRQSLQQVIAGFVGLAISAWFASRTGRAEDYFVRGLLTNLAYGTAFLVSIVVRWPLLGIAMGYLTGEGTTWRRDLQLRRTYAAASWIWVGLFFGRLVIQAPLYFAGAVAPLGVVNILMGWPLFLGAAYFTYRVLAPIYRSRRSGQPAPDGDA